MRKNMIPEHLKKGAIEKAAIVLHSHNYNEQCWGAICLCVKCHKKLNNWFRGGKGNDGVCEDCGNMDVADSNSDIIPHIKYVARKIEWETAGTKTPDSRWWWLFSKEHVGWEFKKLEGVIVPSELI